jgi:hypothetical protein
MHYFQSMFLCTTSNQCYMHYFQSRAQANKKIYMKCSDVLKHKKTWRTLFKKPNCLQTNTNITHRSKGICCIKTILKVKHIGDNTIRKRHDFLRRFWYIGANTTGTVGNTKTKFIYLFLFIKYTYIFCVGFIHTISVLYFFLTCINWKREHALCCHVQKFD